MRPTLLAVLALAAPLPLAAQDLVPFRSPSDNIHCLIVDMADWQGVRCDIADYTPSFRKSPADCDLDWGGAFEVGARGRAVVACVGDTVRDPGAPVLGYGQQVDGPGITCTSLRSGMTCMNADGHGFTLSRALQELF
jgi:hypothetical protein